MSTQPSAAFALAVAHHRAGRLEQAAAAYRNVSVTDPPAEQRAAAANLARIALGAGKLTEAVAEYRKAVAIDDQQPHLWRDLGSALLGSGQVLAAVSAFRRVVELRASDADGQFNFALALEQAGKLIEARAAVSLALTLRPDFPQALNLRGTLSLSGGEAAKGLGDFAEALRLAPNLVEAEVNRSSAFRLMGRLVEARTGCEAAIRLSPHFAPAHAELGQVLRSLGDLRGALASFHCSAELAPPRMPLLLEIAHLCFQMGALETAIESFSAALSLNADDPDALAGLLHAKQYACDWSGIDALEAVTLAKATAGAVFPPFVLVAAGAPDALQTRNAGAWADKVAPVRAERPSARSEPRDRIRLGYLSGDFHDHATAHLLLDVLALHDRAAFEVQAYSYGPDDGSSTRRRIVEAVDGFVDLASWPAPACAERIRADRIDVLIDLKGYTAGARPEIPALRPAPIQVNWLGYPGSMGVDFIDFVLADQTIAPLSLQPLCTERILHLPDCFQPNVSNRQIGPVRSRVDYGLPEHGFVFCCFSNSYKIAPKFFALWMKLLSLVDGSVLWLLDTSQTAKQNLRFEAQAAGIDSYRLVFAPRLTMADHLARHQAADLFLDTLPVNALTTASDALWAGLPVLTMLGNTVAGRGCASLLRAIGLADIVASSTDDYFKLALALAGDATRLAAIQNRLKLNRVTAPLFDTRRFTRNLEAAYLQMICAQLD